MTALHAAVTGASGAIGGAIARALGEAGYQVTTIGRSQGSDVTADLARPEGLAAGAAYLAALDRLALLVHAAGDYAAGGVAEVSGARLGELLTLNTVAPYELTRAALPAIRAAAGTVVFVSSSLTQRVKPGVTAYAASKRALHAIAEGLRAEEGGNGVSVLAVHPGRTAGALQQRIHQSDGEPYDEAYLLRPDDVARAVIAALASSDTAEVTDIHVRPRRVRR